MVAHSKQTRACNEPGLIYAVPQKFNLLEEGPSALKNLPGRKRRAVQTTVHCVVRRSAQDNVVLITEW